MNALVARKAKLKLALRSPSCGRARVGAAKADEPICEQRRDLAPTLLDRLKEGGRTVVAIGKIEDLFAGCGITQAIHTKSDDHGMDEVEKALVSVPDGLIFANLVDFDTVYGHRNDPAGYARNLERFDKLPAAGDVRVNEEFGGRVRAVGTGDVGALAMRAHDAMVARFGRPVDYLRVDLLQWEGRWVVSELELIEPGLYLDVSPANAGPFADLVAARRRTHP